MVDPVSIETPFARLCINPAIGAISELVLTDEGRALRPLHSAPWLDDPVTQADSSIPPVERGLSGDFFCAPFGASDIEGGPSHGPTANSPWTRVPSRAEILAFTLDATFMGARFRKTLTLAADAPLLYQEHEIEGGTGKLSVAHHPMVHVETTGRFATSPKSMAFAADPPLDPGRNSLMPGGSAKSLVSFPCASGGTIDLTSLPIATAHEDFATLVEAADRTFAWSAVLRDAEDDIVFFLKDPRLLPLTMLWHSNAGRDHAPWNGQHRGVLGIEDGRAAGVDGHRAAVSDNAFARLGVPTAFDLVPGRVIRIPHVIGAIARPAGWNTVTDIAVSGDRLVISGPDGERRTLPFRAGFFGQES